MRKYYRCSSTGTLSSPPSFEVDFIESMYSDRFYKYSKMGFDPSMCVKLANGYAVLVIEDTDYSEFTLAHEVGHIVSTSLSWKDDEFSADRYALMASSREASLNFAKYLERLVDTLTPFASKGAIVQDDITLTKQRASIIYAYLNR